jgi:hypothetical protein
MNRLAVIAKLRPKAEEQAEQLIARVPPFDPSGFGALARSASGNRSSTGCPVSLERRTTGSTRAAGATAGASRREEVVR